MNHRGTYRRERTIARNAGAGPTYQVPRSHYEVLHAWGKWTGRIVRVWDGDTKRDYRVANGGE
jgi:hypothetical protein